jgi:hypothetical protein
MIDLSTIPSREDLQAAFWELRKEIDAIKARSAPLREARDAYVNEAQAELNAKDAEMMLEIREIEQDVYEKKMLLARLADLCGNKVGPRPEAAPQAEPAAEV